MAEPSVCLACCRSPPRFQHQADLQCVRCSVLGQNLGQNLGRHVGMVEWSRECRLLLWVLCRALCRPHGFSSVGHVQADTALGQLLLHGLHVFLATFHDPAALLHLHFRHHR